MCAAPYALCPMHCLDEGLKRELTGLSNAQLQRLLETADEDMARAQAKAAARAARAAQIQRQTTAPTSGPNRLGGQVRAAA